MPVEELKNYAYWSVARPARAMWASYFVTRPDKVITILLFADETSYRKWVKRLYDDRNLAHFGYYKPQQRTLVMNISTGTGTLVHELTHALIVYDFPDVPLWFNEGLASLHEQCNVTDDQIVGLVNWRLPALREAIRGKKLRSLRDLLSTRDFYGRQHGLNYAQARYFCMYAQERGLLRQLYKCLRDNRDKPAAGIRAVEEVFGQAIDQVEKRYIAWIVGLD
jgi:hypothetical protein